MRLIFIFAIIIFAIGCDENSSPQVVAWGNNDDGEATVPDGISDAIGIAAGQQHAIVLKSNGTVVSWGNNDRGQLNIPTGLTDVIAVSAGLDHTIVLKSNGTVISWGGEWL